MGRVARTIRLKSGVEVDMILNTIDVGGSTIPAGIIRAVRRDGVRMTDAEQAEVTSWEAARRGAGLNP